MIHLQLKQEQIRLNVHAQQIINLITMEIAFVQIVMLVQDQIVGLNQVQIHRFQLAAKHQHFLIMEHASVIIHKVIMQLPQEPVHVGHLIHPHQIVHLVGILAHHSLQFFLLDVPLMIHHAHVLQTLLLM